MKISLKYHGGFSIKNLQDQERKERSGKMEKFNIEPYNIHHISNQTASEINFLGF